MDALLQEATERWNFVRSETYELLAAISDVDLLFTPKGDRWQPLGYQFGCIGRTQLVYTRAVQSGVMDFTYFASLDLPQKTSFTSCDALRDFLHNTDIAWLHALNERTGGVAWQNKPQSAQAHIAKLAEHERMHHGQLISYFTLAGIALPPQFKKNWAL